MLQRRGVALIAAIALTIPIGVLEATTTGAAAVAALPPAADRMPGDVPSKKTPWVLDGEVNKIVQVGNTMIAGGLFTQVADPMNGTPYTRQNLVRLRRDHGPGQPDLQPDRRRRRCSSCCPARRPTRSTSPATSPRSTARAPTTSSCSTSTPGRPSRRSRRRRTNGGIETMELLPDNRLFIGGFFTKIGGVTHGQFATLNATTGALDPFMDLVAAGNHNTGTGAKAPIGPRESGRHPGRRPHGRRRQLPHRRRAGPRPDRDDRPDRRRPPPCRRPGTPRGYTPICSPGAFDSYMRDVEMSPDGSFFVVATTGGPHSGTLCDTAARFETYAVGTALTPTWTNTSGGDTLWGVEVTQSAVYVGGHNRWMNNPSGSDRAAPGRRPAAGPGRRSTRRPASR